MSNIPCSFEETDELLDGNLADIGGDVVLDLATHHARGTRVSGRCSRAARLSTRALSRRRFVRGSTKSFQWVHRPIFF